jgi:hypothetical protein
MNHLIKDPSISQISDSGGDKKNAFGDKELMELESGANLNSS